MSVLSPGDVVAGRFDVEREAGRGGMGIVYRAADRSTGQVVALKVLHAATSQAARFAREAEVLADLDHPAIVRFVGHGDLPGGAAYIALEWLEGEDLATRLSRAGLTPAEAVGLVRRVAEALSVAHAIGVVHRDIKPSNLFLVGGQPEGVKLLDFGVARIATATHTQTGTVLGTPAYMAPEQARGERGVDARADVFSLGAVLHECLTGKPPFAGEHVMAILAKILLEEAPHVRWTRPDLPQALDDLVARMLAKDPDGRPRNAAAVVAALGELRDLGGERSPTSRGGTAITTSEQRLLTIVLGAQPGASTATWDPAAPTLADDGARVLDVRAMAEAHGLGFVPMLGSSWVATASARASARDQAGRAARFALAVRAAAPRAVLAVVTGRGLAGESVPIGEVIDRAVAIVKRASRRTTLVDADDGRPVRLDDVSAGLLDARFLVSSDRDGLFLFGIQREAPARMLLGRRTPLVGRDRELAIVGSLLDECVGDRVARAVVLVGESGMGKSRLVQEAIERGRAAHADLRVWSGRADSMSAGSPLALLASAVGGAFGLVEGGPAVSEVVEIHRERILERVSRRVAPADARRVAEFIGELVGYPFPDRESVELRAARADAVLLGDQMRRAWEDLVLAESAAAPLVLVLEDLHWGDLSTVRFVDAALRVAKERPFLVVATARPEVRETFPSLWRDRATDELKLTELSAAASRRLVREVLGASADPELVDRLVARAGGHALHLEELLRAAAAGEGDAEAPTSVMAMIEARIDGLDATARRVLRAASVFGEVCWSGGIAALLTDLSRADVDRWIRDLVAREHLVERAPSRFPGERELGFRHAVVRDAAYGMLPDRDRTTGHRLAAEWLATSGERDALVLAEHFDRGGQPARAVASFRRAAEEALRGDDYDAAFARIERAVACGAVGEELGMLRLLEADAAMWHSQTSRVVEAADAAASLLPFGSAAWLRARGRAAMADWRLGREERLRALADDFASGAVPTSETSAWVECATEAAVHLLRSGHVAAGEKLIGPLSQVGLRIGAREPAAAGHVHRARAWLELYRSDDVASLEAEQEAIKCFRLAGDVRSECRHQSGAAYQRMLLGDYEGAAADLEAARASAERMGLGSIEAEAEHNLGFALARLGRLEEAIAVELEALAVFERLDPRMAAACHKYLAMMLLEAGDLEAAERHARAAILVPELQVAFRPYFHAMLAKVLLARGDFAGARDAMATSTEIMRGMDVVEEGEVFIRVTQAEVLAATGHRDGARDAARVARDLVLARASRIRDAAWRARFLERVSENVDALRLAAQYEE